jgi:hypothetical protein
MRTPSLTVPLAKILGRANAVQALKSYRRGFQARAFRGVRVTGFQ